MILCDQKKSFLWSFIFFIYSFSSLTFHMFCYGYRIQLFSLNKLRSCVLHIILLCSLFCLKGLYFLPVILEN